MLTMTAEFAAPRVPEPRRVRASHGPAGDADKALRILTGWQATDFRGYAVAEKRADRRLVVVSLSFALAAHKLPVSCLLITPDDIAVEQWRRHLAGDDSSAARRWSVRTADSLVASGICLDSSFVVVADEPESYLDESFVATVSAARAILGLCASSSGLGGTALRRFIGRPVDTGHAATALDLSPLARRGTTQDDAGPGDAREQLVAVADPEDLLGLYLRQAQKIPLLTAQEEIELATQIEAGVLAEAALTEGPGSFRATDVRAKSRWSAGMERDLRMLVAQGREAKQLFLVSNLRLVYWIARRYSTRMDIMDAVQEGSLGLIRAVEKYDHSKGNKFSTYATWWVRQAITRALADQVLQIRLPVHVHESDTPVLHEARRRNLEGISAAPADIAAELKMDPEQVAAILRRHRPPVSLEQLVDDGVDIEDPFSFDHHDAAVLTLLRHQVEAVLIGLPERESQVVRLRFGFDDGEVKTLDEIGKTYGLTRERIRQIESKALTTLRHRDRATKLRPYFEGKVDPELGLDGAV